MTTFPFELTHGVVIRLREIIKPFDFLAKFTDKLGTMSASPISSPSARPFALARVGLAIFYALLFSAAGEFYSLKFGNYRLLAGVVLFLVPAGARWILVLREKWNARLTLFFTLGEMAAMAGLHYWLMLHLNEGPRFLLQPFSYGYFVALLLFSAAEGGRVELLTLFSAVLTLRIAAIVACVKSGVYFTTEFSYLDRFVYLWHEGAYLMGYFAEVLAAYLWAPKQVKVRTVVASGRGVQEIDVAAKKAPDIRTAFLLFLDIRDYATLSAKLSPGQMRRLLREFHDKASETIVRHAGQIESKEGGGILAHFGVDRAEPKSAAKGMTCVEELIATLDNWNQERAAQNEPLVEVGFSGVVANFFLEKKGDGQRLDLSLVGESVNLIKCLEKHNPSINARVSTTRQTLEMAAAQGFVLSSYVRSLPKEKIKDLSFKLDIVVLAERTDPKREAA